jgi:exodeoxyribonuclease VII small subunit
MSKPAKDCDSGTSLPEGMPFEEALKQLESIVGAMEADDLPLESLLTRYEEGARLVMVCQSRLADADQKIQQLEQKLGGEMQLKPLPMPDDSVEA